MSARPRITSAAFFDRLRSLHTLEERRAFERELGTEAATILAADSSGFTRTTQRYGIVHFLGVMILVYDEILPLIERSGGTVLSENADNVLAIFAEPRSAVAAAEAVHAAIAVRNASLPEAERFAMCIGVDHGPVLRLADNAYGDHVNKSFKIGEDFARRGETLVTEVVARHLPGSAATYIRSERLGDEEVRLYRVGPPSERSSAAPTEGG